MKLHPLTAYSLTLYVPPMGFTPALTVSIPLRPHECREERADNLRKWCAANCVGRWRPMERWTHDAVRIEFESLTDVMAFRSAN